MYMQRNSGGEHSGSSHAFSKRILFAIFLLIALLVLVFALILVFLLITLVVFALILHAKHLLPLC